MSLGKGRGGEKKRFLSQLYLASSNPIWFLNTFDSTLIDPGLVAADSSGDFTASVKTLINRARVS